MNVLKRVSKNFVFLFTGNFISQLILFYCIIFIAKKLTIEEFGRFSFAQAYTLFFVRLSEFGLETIAIRKAVVELQHRKLVSSIIVTRFLITIPAVILAYFFLFYIPVSQETKSITAICLVLVFSQIFLIEWYYQAIEKMHVVALSRIVRSLFFAVPLLLIPFSSGGDRIVVQGYVMSFFVSTFVLFIYFLRQNSISLLSYSLSDFTNLLKETFPIGTSTTLMQIPFNSGTFLIGLLLNAESVGLYSAAYRIALVVWSFGIIAIYNSIFPLLSSKASQHDEFIHLIKKLTTIFTIGAGVLTICAIGLSSWIMEILYHGKFSEANNILQISLITIAVILARVAIEYSLLAINKPYTYLRGMIFASVLYICLGYIGISNYGIVGMAYAALCAELLYTVFVLSQFKFKQALGDIVSYWMKSVVVIGFSTLAYLLIPENHYVLSFFAMIVTFSVGIFILHFSFVQKLFSRIRV